MNQSTQDWLRAQAPQAVRAISYAAGKLLQASTSEDRERYRVMVRNATAWWLMCEGIDEDGNETLSVQPGQNMLGLYSGRCQSD